ncbi:hypothetical protein FRC07_006969 [Ceratobasidium sp. 392]|nr:hypothetical protein FRC07_006969 [Ceratobasidium sp. 392]
MTQLEAEDIEELTTELRSIQGAFNEVYHQRRGSYCKAQLELEGLDEIGRRLKFLVKLTKMRMQVNETAALEYEGFDMIKVHEIIDQVALPPYPPRSSWLEKLGHISISPEAGAGSSNVLIRRHAGRVGTTRVIYVTYSSATTRQAEKRAREELSWMSNCPYDTNIAKIFGVTKGPLLNGIVLTSALLSCEDFFHSVNDPAAWAKCFRELLSVQSYFNSSRGIYPLDVGVDPSGSVTVTPTNDSFAGRYLPHFLPYKKFPDPVTKTLSLAFVYPPKDFPWSAVLNQLVHAYGSFTLLKIYRVADNANAFPIPTILHWCESQVPPYTIDAGEVGVYSEEPRSSATGWIPIGHHRVARYQGPIIFCRKDKRSGTPHPAAVANINGWITYELSHCLGLLAWVSDTPLDSSLGWKEFVTHWTTRSKSPPYGAKLEALSLFPVLQAHI